MKARELGQKSVVVGDIAQLVGDLSGKTDTLARIVGVDERKNVLTRTVDDGAQFERMIVSNVDQMAIVISTADPEPRHGFVDRALVVAFDQKITPIIIVTKCDLASADEFLIPYNSLHVQTLKTQRGADLSDIRDLLHGKRTVFIGHSGVGKSTLFNSLAGEDLRNTGDVNDVTGRGRHTSSSSYAFSLGTDTWIIDTPGVRSFGLAHVERNRVVGAFPEFAEAIEHCPRNCSHDEDDCALNHWELSDDSRERLKNLRNLLNERE